MDKVDSLIKILAEFKEELNKNMNSSYGSTNPNMAKASKDPALAPKEVKIKELQGKIDAGTYKPDASKIADKMLKKTPNDASAAAPPANGVPEMAKDEPHKDDPHHEAKEKKIASKVKAEAQDLLDMHKEELMCSANGQWNIKGAKY